MSRIVASQKLGGKSEEAHIPDFRTEKNGEPQIKPQQR
jgi:hypothetical protein